MKKKIKALLAHGRMIPAGSPPTLPLPRYEVSLSRDGRISWKPPSAVVSGALTQAVIAVPDPGPAGTTWTCVARACSAHGVTGQAAQITLRLVSDGLGLLARPNSPGILSVEPLADGDVEVVWYHDDAWATAAAASFAVYASSGPQMDFGSPAGVASQSSRRLVLSGLAPDVPHRIVVRALSAAGASDGNQICRVVVPRSTPPAGLGSDALTAVQY